MWPHGSHARALHTIHGVALRADPRRPELLHRNTPNSPRTISRGRRRGAASDAPRLRPGSSLLRRLQPQEAEDYRTVLHRYPLKPLHDLLAFARFSNDCIGTPTQGFADNSNHILRPEPNARCSGDVAPKNATFGCHGGLELPEMPRHPMPSSSIDFDLTA